MVQFIENLQDLKDNKEFVLSEIREYLRIEGQDTSNKRVKAVALQVFHIVTASNYAELDYMLSDLINEAIEVTENQIEIIDMGSFNRESALKNLPSSMR